MDGGSTDGTLRILRSYASPVLFWVSKKDKGQAAAINTGMRKATGDIIGYINSDDVYQPGALHTVAEFFNKHPGVMWLTGDCRIVGEHGQEIQSWIRMYKKMLRLIPPSIVLPIVNPIAQPSTFWRSELLQRVGFLDETRRYAFDYDFWLRLSKEHPPAVILDVLSSFRIHKTSKGGKEYVRQFEEELQILAQHTDNRLARRLHELHNRLIVSVYNTVK